VAYFKTLSLYSPRLFDESLILWLFNDAVSTTCLLIYFMVQDI